MKMGTVNCHIPLAVSWICYMETTRGVILTQFPNTETIQGDADMHQGYTSKDKESTSPLKKRLRATKPKIKNKKKGGTKSKNPTH